MKQRYCHQSQNLNFDHVKSLFISSLENKRDTTCNNLSNFPSFLLARDLHHLSPFQLVPMLKNNFFYKELSHCKLIHLTEGKTACLCVRDQKAGNEMIIHSLHSQEISKKQTDRSFGFITYQYH